MEYFKDVLVAILNEYIKDYFSNKENKDFYITFYTDDFVASIVRWLKDKNCMTDVYKRQGEYFKSIYEMGADAVLVSDPGVYTVLKEYAPDLELHVSTQANNTNYKTCLLYTSRCV